MKENIKEIILEKSRQLFNEHGYHKVTMRMIADACDIRVGNLTYHYKKKKDIMNDLLKNGEPSKEITSVESLQDLYNYIYEMVDGVRKNHFFFSSSEMQNLDEDFFLTNKKNVQAIHKSFIKHLIHLQEKKVLSSSFSKEEMEAYVSMMMLAHLSWSNEEGKNSTYTSLTFKQFVLKHIILLKPYLTTTGLKQFEKLK